MTDPQYRPGDIVNGHRLIEQPDGSLAWVPVSADPRPGDIVNGHRLTEQPDGSLAWLPVSAETQPEPGAIVNGHQLTRQADGSLAWLPVEQAAKPKRSLKPLWIGAAVVVGLIILIPTIGNLGSSDADPVADKVPTAEQVDEEAEPEPEPELVAIPAILVGLTAADAAAALTGLGLEPVYDGEADAKVIDVVPAAGTEVEEGAVVTLVVEQKPKLTLAQANAVGSAEAYLRSMGFSRSGLIGQLEYEGFSTGDATFAVDYVAPDWNTEAAETAQAYLGSMSFSRQGLYDQLIYEGFTPEQVEAGLAAVGY